MAHGFSAVKEMYLDRFAEVFAAAGLTALVFDNRNFGASDGEPRQEIDPWAQVRDYRHAITYAEHPAGSRRRAHRDLGVQLLRRPRPGRRRDRPAGQGRGEPGAADQRSRQLRALVRSDFIAGFREMFDADRRARFEGKPPAMVPVVDEDPLGASALPTADSWQWFTETGKTRAPSWRNEVTLRSVEMFTEYEPGELPALYQPDAAADGGGGRRPSGPSELAIAAYDTAHEPKKLVILPGGHFDAYVKGFDAASIPARDWFARHLAP